MKQYSRKTFMIALLGVLTGTATLSSCAGSRGSSGTDDRRGNKRTNDRKKPKPPTNDRDDDDDDGR